jgi:hypothetical protein
MNYLVVSMFSIVASGCTTSADTVYVYDNADRISKMVNDIPVWRDASSAQSSNRFYFEKGNGPVRCVVGDGNLPARAARRQIIGKAVGVRVYGSCTGFVNSRYVHAEK